MESDLKMVLLDCKLPNQFDSYEVKTIAREASFPFKSSLNVFKHVVIIY